MPKPFPAEFRRDVVAVARKHEAPISQIAKDLGISEATRLSRVAQVIGALERLRSSEGGRLPKWGTNG